MNSAWKRWVLENTLKGVSGKELYFTLINHGFVHDQIVPLLGANLSESQKQQLANRYRVLVPKPAFLGDEKSVDSYSSNITNSDTVAYETFGNSDFCVYKLTGCFDSDLCEAAVNSIKKGLRPSTITTVSSDKPQQSRTSSTCDFASLEADLAERLSEKLKSLMGKVHDTSEPIQAQHYGVQQEFKQHTDYFEPGSSEYSKFAGRRGQRSWTCMVYLNTVERGGETEFLYLKKRFSPKQGDVLVWCNVHKNGVVNPQSLHQAHPVSAGEKYIITQWCRLIAPK
ncbi:2OG-Fe(II) oxygenase [Alteromonas sp.]|uniref:prolyl hydroxylase family protein n=1 Tax=Alteromonas sp. TaxID=232 RepID=UPI000B71204C|nr:2OG-Fe(II) oxygenase [Alteromonas sp.]MAI37839.1 oxygenase [Alteromonas sp.]OUX87360.1 MAG: hypothetical protein CBB95_09275 [Alteromonas sp. TMED35]